MKYLKTLFIGLAIISGVLTIASCSGSSKNFQTPVSPDPQIPSLISHAMGRGLLL